MLVVGNAMPKKSLKENYKTIEKSPYNGSFSDLNVLTAETIEHMMKDLPDFDKTRIDDVMVEMPWEAEQGLNVGRLISLMGLKSQMFPEMVKQILLVW